MAIRLYMDHHVARSITLGLRIRHVDVLTAYEDDSHDIPDSELLDRATTLGRVLFSQDDDLLAEATQRQRAGIPFGGVIYAHQTEVSIGQLVHDLELIAELGAADEVLNQVIYLPL